MRKLRFPLVSFGLICLCGWPLNVSAQDTVAKTAESSDTFPVHIEIDAANPIGALKPIWRFFGADEPNYAYMKDGKKLIKEEGQLKPNDVYFRAHNMLTSGDGTPALKWGSTNAYREDADGKPIYDWTITDRIFDTYLERGVKPYAQIGFMPEAMSIKPEPYQHHFGESRNYGSIYTGWSYPPKDFAKWGELAHQWVKHCMEKYGREEVEKWYWEVWNEPNIGYWHGTPEEFRKLHDFAIDGVRRALPTAKVGGSDAAGSGGKFTRDFLEHCLRGTNYATGETGTPIDFISFHAKGAPAYVDAVGQPTRSNGHQRMGIANQLRTIEDGFRIIATFPELKDKPIVIGESDPDGCAACQGPQLSYRNNTMYSSYTAASFGREQALADKHGVNLEGALTWAFEFEDQPLFAGFRVLATGGIDLPVFNVFRMFSKMSGQRVAVESDAAIPLETIVQSGVRDRADVSALASLDGGKLCVMVWHYHDDDVPGPAAEVDLQCSGLPSSIAEAKLQEYRIDHDHTNPFIVWQSMGSPKEPTPEQYASLEKAGQLAEMAPLKTVKVDGGKVTIPFTLPRQGISLFVLEPNSSSK
jgi:xylan 1,4-beta-xylosidase